MRHRHHPPTLGGPAATHNAPPRRPLHIQSNSSPIKQKSQPSLNLALKRQKAAQRAAGELPDDVGLLIDSFITPVRAHRPSLLASPLARLRFERRRLRARTRDAFQLLVYKFYFAGKPRRGLDLWRIGRIAADLHAQMYAAFASGALADVEARLCAGIRASLQKRVAGRAPNARLRWTMHGHVRRPRLVSYRAGMVAAGEGPVRGQGTGVVQAVVRLCTRQSLVHVQRETVRAVDGRVETRDVPVNVPGSGSEEREMVEYFVVQRSVRKGVAGPWMVWGTTGETTV